MSDETTLSLATPSRGRGRVFRTLTTRAVFVTCLVALTSVLVTALVAFPLAVREANAKARAGLSDKAELMSDWLQTRPATTTDERIVRRLRQQGVAVFLVHAGKTDKAGLPQRVVTTVAAGESVSVTGLINNRVSLIEGRPLAGAGNAVVLTEPAVTGAFGQVMSRLWFALLAGLLAGGFAGALLARRLARPIRNAAAAAARLSAGDRSVRVSPEPPAEAEDLAHALNDLASALATSEGRQRDFLLSISHELRTPLTTLRGYAEALADGVVGAEGAQLAGQTMQAEADRLDRLVTDLLALARLEAADFPLSVINVDLTALMADAAQAWTGRCTQAGIPLHAELPPVPVVVPTDPGRIRQVIDGLLENALRVVPAGAPLVLAVREPVSPGYATVEVRDGGPGFSDADLPMVFERGAMYERYRGIRKVGSGLGLALAAGLVRRLGGTIEAGHAPEGGARFTVWLPVRAPGTRADSAYQARTPA